MTFLLLIPSIIRTILVLFYDLSPLDGTFLLSLIPDLLFLGLSIKKALLDREQKKSLFVWLMMLVLFGLMFWDQGPLVFFIHLIFPSIMFMGINRDKYSNINITKIIIGFVRLAVNPIFLIFKKIKNSLNNAPSESQQAQNTFLSGYKKSLIIGLGFGIAIIGLLSNIDPGFKDFLEKIINFNIWDVVWKFIIIYIFYSFSYFWFFLNPFTTTWSPKKEYPKLEKIVHQAIVIILTIIIGYSLYDTYILLRVFKVIELAYESMGQNTQLYYFELTLLGGTLLFGVAKIINKFFIAQVKQTNRKHKLKLCLLLSVIWLVPPVYNIIRALVAVYIPQYGLTLKRLTGLYTVVAFIISFAVLLQSYYKKSNLIFINSLLSFVLSIFIMIALLPNNLMIMNWHLNKYLSGETVDLEYIEKLNIGKWGFIFSSKFDDQKYKSDLLLELMLVNPKINNQHYEYLKQEFLKTYQVDANVILTSLYTNQLESFIQYLPKDNRNSFFVYQDSLPAGMKIYLPESKEEMIEDRLTMIENGLSRLHSDFNNYYLVTRYLPSFSYKTEVFGYAFTHSIEINYVSSRNKDHIFEIEKRSSRPLIYYYSPDFCSDESLDKYPTREDQYYCSNLKYRFDPSNNQANNLTLADLEEYYGCQFNSSFSNSCFAKYFNKLSR